MLSGALDKRSGCRQTFRALDTNRLESIVSFYIVNEQFGSGLDLLNGFMLKLASSGMIAVAITGVSSSFLY